MDGGGLKARPIRACVGGRAGWGCKGLDREAACVAPPAGRKAWLVCAHRAPSLPPGCTDQPITRDQELLNHQYMP